MKNSRPIPTRPALNLVFFFVSLLSLAHAQGKDWLVGTWQYQLVQVNEGWGDTYVLTYVITFNEDGSYTQENLETNWDDKGTYQFSGSTLAQQWHDTLFGDKSFITMVDILDDNSFRRRDTNAVYTRTSAKNPVAQQTNPPNNTEASKLVGSWQADIQGQTVHMTLNEDGTYIFDVPSQNKQEGGTWQFDGITFAQQWELFGGVPQGIMYRLEFTSDSSFVVSGGDVSVPVTFTKVVEQTTQAPASANDLVGSWWAQVGNVVILQTIAQDGSYTFEVPSQNYLEKGTWQLDGANYSQQWNDPNTGEAQQATYTIGFLSKDSFRQSGGNLENNTVYTFNRGTPPESATTSSKEGEIRPASGPPQAGDYVCSYIGFVTRMRQQPRYDPILGIWTFGLEPYLDVTVSPSPLGTLTLDGQGNFTQSSNGEKGTYSYDEATKQVKFSGFLGTLPTRYGENTFVFSDTSSGSALEHTCQRNAN